MRAHIEWKVLTHIVRATPPTRSSMRSRISPAALLVKVMARISSGRAWPAAMRWATRWVSTRVLPEPAPARMSSGPSDVRDGLALRLVEAGEQRSAAAAPGCRPGRAPSFDPQLEQQADGEQDAAGDDQLETREDEALARHPPRKTPSAKHSTKANPDADEVRGRPCR